MNESKQWTIGDILAWTGQYFKQKGVDNPRLDAEVLLSHVLGQNRLYLYVHFDQPLVEQELAAYREMVKSRVNHMPVAYITGKKEFMGLEFAVTPDVLIPRPDTEILVEAVMNRLCGIENPDILDIGTGSGAIFVSLLAKVPHAGGIAVDVSAPALAVGAANAARYLSGRRMDFRQGDLFSAVTGCRFDCIVSNPPYIPDGDIPSLEAEVRREPRLALAGGKDGLDFYRRIVKESPGYVNPGGFVVMEVGIHQASAVAALAEEQHCFAVEDIIKDYGGIERVVVLRLGGT